MRILFFCTSLESGRDGVGDYTRLLAVECARAGHDCRMVSINDPHLGDSAPIEETQEGLRCLRLSSAHEWSARAEAATAWARDFAPDWQSWQIVPYGFHAKGVIPRDAREFAAAFAHGPGRRHVMLHELWIGLSAQERFRQRFVGGFQRRALKKFLRALHPTALDTSNPTYLTTLIRNDIAASHLPLYGNVPLVTLPDADAAGKTGATFFTGVIFGTVHPQFLHMARQTVSVLSAGAQASSRTLRLVLAGHTGQHGEALIESLKNFAEPGQIELEQLGEISAEDVSRILQRADFGIATHPWALLGKSGAVAAMLDHGLPVIVPRDDWSMRGRAAPPFAGYWPYASGLVSKLSEVPPEHMAGWLAHRRAPKNRVPEIAAQFLERLSAATNPAYP